MSDTETKAEKFTRLSEARLAKSLEAMTILGKVANARDYDYTEAEARDLLGRLRSGISELEEKFGISFDEADTPEEGGATAGDEAVPAPAETRSETVDLGALRREVRDVNGTLMRTDPGAWGDIDLIHAGPRLGLALEAAMARDCEAVVSLLSDVMRS